MADGDSGDDTRGRTGPAARGLAHALLLLLGGAVGWQMAWWQDLARADEIVLAAVEDVASYGLAPFAPAGAALAQAERMPDLVVEIDPQAHPEADPDAVAWPAPEADLEPPVLVGDEVAEGVQPDLGPEPMLAPPELTAVLDPRDRSIVPPLAGSSESHPGPVPARAALTAGPAVAAGRRVGALAAYVVGPGDTVASVAAQFGVDLETVRMANNLGPNPVLQIGQALHVPTINAAIHVVASGETLSSIALRHGVEPATLIAANELEGNLIVPGQRLLIPGGVRPLQLPLAATPTSAPTARPAPPTPRPPTTTALPTPLTTARSAQPTPTRPPATPPRPSASPAAAPRAAAGANPAVVSPLGPLVWPLGGTLTQRFGENGHTGIDLAAPTGAPVRAIVAGTVVVAAKLSYGYGWRIILDHGSGYTSLYAHLSSFTVSEGARVARGQALGSVGSTGLSTGPHLHFEILANGQPVDPLKLLP